MQVEFDAVKDASNQAKHGVPLALARRIDWARVLCMPDTRRDYGELREIGFAVIEHRL